MLKLFDFAALAVYCGFIYFLSAQPSLPMPVTFEFQDKVHHMTAYFIMAVLAWRSFRHFSSKVNKLEISTVLFCSLYGLSDEWHQSFVPGRTSEAMDWVANTFGAALAVYLLSRFLVRQTLFSLPSGKAVQAP